MPFRAHCDQRPPLGHYSTLFFYGTFFLFKIKKFEKNNFCYFYSKMKTKNPYTLKPFFPFPFVSVVNTTYASCFFFQEDRMRLRRKLFFCLLSLYISCVVNILCGKYEICTSFFIFFFLFLYISCVVNILCGKYKVCTSLFFQEDRMRDALFCLLTLTYT